MKNNLMEKIAITVGIVFVIAIVAFIFLFKKEDNNNQEEMVLDEINNLEDINKNGSRNLEVKGKFFVTTKENDFLNIFVYDFKNNELLKSKKIKLEDDLSGHTPFFAVEANDTVQYNSITDEVIFATSGTSEYGGSCINKDGSCLDRIYKIGMSDSEKIKIFETEETIVKYILNEENNSLVMETYQYSENFEKRGKYIIKIDTSNGNIIYKKSIDENMDPSGQPSRSEFVYLNDGEKIFQTKADSPSGKTTADRLRLDIINSSTGEIKEQLISDEEGKWLGGAIINLSPNNNFLAFVQEKDKNNYNLNIFDLLSSEFIDSPINCHLTSFGMFWSIDNKKILYYCDDDQVEGYYYYDIDRKTNTKIEELSSDYSVVAWSPSNFITYHIRYGTDKGIYIFDLNKKVSVKLPLSIGDGIYGTRWF